MGPWKECGIQVAKDKGIVAELVWAQHGCSA